MSVIVKDLIRNYYHVDESTQFDLDLAVKDLAKSGGLSSDELVVIKMTMEGAERHTIAEAISASSSSTVSKRLNSASKKIAAYLGDAYSDERILNRAEQKLGRPLTETEIAFCWFMIRFHGRKINKDLNIYNFRIGRDGRFIAREDKTEGQVDV